MREGLLGYVAKEVTNQSIFHSRPEARLGRGLWA